MVANTRTARVGTGIAYAFARTPYAHASAARTLHKKAPGRIFLGLGSGAYSINRDWFGVESACAVLDMPPSTYYAAKKRESEASARSVRDEWPKKEIMRVWADKKIGRRVEQRPRQKQTRAIAHSIREVGRRPMTQPHLSRGLACRERCTVV